MATQARLARAGWTIRRRGKWLSILEGSTRTRKAGSRTSRRRATLAQRSRTTPRRRLTTNTRTARSRRRPSRSSRKTRTVRSSSAPVFTGRTVRSSRRGNTSICIRSSRFLHPRHRGTPARRPRRGSPRRRIGTWVRRVRERPSGRTTRRSAFSTRTSAGSSTRSTACASWTTRSSSSSAITATTWVRRANG